MQTHALHLPATARPRGPTPRRFGDHLDPRGHPRATIVHYGPTHTGPPTTASPSRAPGQPRARAPTLQTHALHSPATFRPRGSTPRRFGDQPDPRGHQAHHYAVYHYHGGVPRYDMAEWWRRPPPHPPVHLSSRPNTGTYQQLPAREDPLPAGYLEPRTLAPGFRVRPGCASAVKAFRYFRTPVRHFRTP